MKPLVDTTYSLSNAVNDNSHFELVDADHQDISILYNKLKILLQQYDF